LIKTWGGICGAFLGCILGCGVWLAAMAWDDVQAREWVLAMPAGAVVGAALGLLYPRVAAQVVMFFGAFKS
jgi:hypothetical protein